MDPNTPTPFDIALFSGGQPSAEDLEQLASAGVRTVINLRGTDEAVGFDARGASQALGLHYVALPIRNAGDLDPDRVRQFGCALDHARELGGTLVHCASGNRAGAMVALDAAINRALPVDVALQRGRSAGLRELEPAVVQLLADKLAR